MLLEYKRTLKGEKKQNLKQRHTPYQNNPRANGLYKGLFRRSL